MAGYSADRGQQGRFCCPPLRCGQTNALARFFDRLPPSLIKKNNVSLFPEGALGYLIGPTLALLANSILSNYFLLCG